MILITRPRKSAARTAELLQLKGLRNLVLPLIHIRYLHKNIEDQNYDAVVTTSQNALYVMYDLKWLKDKKIYTTGNVSKSALQAKQFSNVIAGDKDAIHLSNLIKNDLMQSSKILYLAGNHTAQDIDLILSQDGYTVVKEIVYQSIIVKTLSDSAVQIIQNQIDCILFYSPRTAQAFYLLALKHQFDLHNKIAVCISSNTALEIIKLNWGELLISDFPNEARMLDKITTKLLK